MTAAQKRIASLFQKMDREIGRISANPVPKTVHQFRTTARRVEAALEELMPEADRNRRKLLKQLSRLRRRAGRVRDMDIQVTALRNLRVAEASRAKTQVLQALSELRTKRESRLQDSLDKATMRELRRRLKKARERFPGDLPDPLRLAGQLLSKFAEEQSPIDEKVLHRCRILGKRIRYTAELAGDEPEAQRMVAELKRMQDALGEWHDWLTLAGSVRRLLPGNPNSSLLLAVSNIMRAKYRDAVQAVANTKAALLRKPSIAASQLAAVGRRKASSTDAAAAVA